MPRCSSRPRRAAARRPGFTFVEMVLVVTMITILFTLVGLGGMSLLRGERIKEDVGLFARTLRTAAEQAIFRQKTLVVVIEVTDGYYTVFEENEDNDYRSEDIEPVIDRKSLDVCYIDLMEWEDGSQQFSGEAYLRATPQGWKSAVLFEFLDDRDAQRCYVRIDRLTPRVVFSRQPLELLQARSSVSMSNPI